jgi:phosphotriesterase-related protein
MLELFIGDIRYGIADTGVKAGVLKCAIDEAGLTPGVERVMRAVATTQTETGTPAIVHTHANSEMGRKVIDVFRSEGADLSKVVIGHSGDSTDLAYLSELADTGVLLGMDRFGIDVISPFEDRVNVVAEMAKRGYATSMVLSHDASCFSDLYPAIALEFQPNWNYTHIHDDVLPALRERGVSEDDIETMLIKNPVRYFEGAA